MAPEILSLQPYSVNSDVYSFAMVLYVLIAEQVSVVVTLFVCRTLIVIIIVVVVC